MQKRRPYWIAVIFILFSFFSLAQQDSVTYAERLGFPKGTRVIIFHVDDAGMSFDSNKGAIEALEKGMASSTSVMMPCPWVPGFVHYLREHPGTDAGLHLTLTSEWKDYRWGPLSGRTTVPGLVDKEGDLWPDVADVVKHASLSEVEKEIRAQLERAKLMGFQPTHLDSHMGTLFANSGLIQLYVRIGMEYKIPVMFPGGHNTMVGEQMRFTKATLEMTRQVGAMLWKSGLPVLDDLHNLSYDWILPAGIQPTKENWKKYKLDQYEKTLRALRPGVTMVIMHCTVPSGSFAYISDSGPAREADLMVMLDPGFKQFIHDEGIIITTWKELKERRDKVN